MGAVNWIHIATPKRNKLILAATQITIVVKTPSLTPKMSANARIDKASAKSRALERIGKSIVSPKIVKICVWANRV